jgi:hypothetical protein
MLFKDVEIFPYSLSPERTTGSIDGPGTMILSGLNPIPCILHYRRSEQKHRHGRKVLGKTIYRELTIEVVGDDADKLTGRIGIGGFKAEAAIICCGKRLPCGDKPTWEVAHDRTMICFGKGNTDESKMIFKSYRPAGYIKNEPKKQKAALGKVKV